MVNGQLFSSQGITYNQRAFSPGTFTSPRGHRPLCLRDRTNHRKGFTLWRTRPFGRSTPHYCLTRHSRSSPQFVPGYISVRVSTVYTHKPVVGAWEISVSEMPSTQITRYRQLPLSAAHVRSALYRRESRVFPAQVLSSCHSLEPNHGLALTAYITDTTALCVCHARWLLL